MSCVNIFTGTVSVLATTVLDLYGREISETVPVNRFFKAVFPWLLPNYSLGRGIMDIATNHYYKKAAEMFNFCPVDSCDKKPLDWDVGGRFVFALFLMSFVWFGLRVLIEWRCLCRRRRSQPAPPPRRGKALDEAVIAESDRV